MVAESPRFYGAVFAGCVNSVGLLEGVLEDGGRGEEERRENPWCKRWSMQWETRRVEKGPGDVASKGREA